MKSRLGYTFVVGFAVFAMLFGAGNLIFPPFLGMAAGENWIWGFIGFVLLDVVCSVIVLLVIAKKGEGANGIVGILGEKLSKLMMLAMVICIGPLVAIPRTAATTYELSVQPIFPQIRSEVVAIIFFGIVFFMCIKPSKIIDIVGAVLSPLLLVTLGVLILKGILFPLGTVTEGKTLSSVVNMGVSSGYQTLDAMGAVVLSIVILASVKNYHLESKKEEGILLRNACVIAGVSLALVYGGLTYLGATVSGVYPAGLDRTQLMIRLASDILGRPGMLFLGIIVAAACLTTAIGLVSSSASFLEEILRGKVSYRSLVLFICIFSGVICNFGLSAIISFAAPILNMLYPILLILLVLALFPDKLLEKCVQWGAIGGTALFAAFQLIEDLAGISSLTTRMPFASLGFGWVLPALLGAALGAAAGKLKVLFEKEHRAIVQ